MIIAAAWVPEHKDMTWEDAEELAADWTEERCAIEQRHGLLLQGTLTEGPFANRPHPPTWLEVASPRSKDVSYRNDRPVIARCPDAPMLELASRLARGSSICLVEGVDRWIGWAIEMQALDLTTGEVTPDPRTDAQREVFDRLDMFKNNAFWDSYAKQVVPRLLRDLLAPGSELTPSMICGIALARGASANGVKNLRRYLEKPARRR